jgi:hypothetical protein
MSSLSEADLRNESIHLGPTLYGSRWWGTQVNPESKLLLMTHCFGDCGYGWVQAEGLGGQVEVAAAGGDDRVPALSAGHDGVQLARSRDWVPERAAVPGSIRGWQAILKVSGTVPVPSRRCSR